MSSMSTPPPGTECPEHRGRAATGYCGACYRPMCDECRDSSSPEPRCRQCSLREILTEVETQWEEKAKRNAGVPAEDENSERQKHFLHRVVLGAVTLVVAALMMTSLSDTCFRGRPVYAVNLPLDGGPGLNGCLRELWEIRSALEQYMARHGQYPHTLAEATGGKTPHCPACGQPYRYKRIDGQHYLLLCPDPGRHHVGGVRVNSGSAPTIVDDDGG